MRLSVEKLRERSQAAWARKRRWYPLHRECYTYAAPGLNPYDEGLDGVGAGSREGGGIGESLVDHLFDSTAVTDVKLLSNRIAQGAFPPGERYAEIHEGESFAPEEPSSTKTGRMLDELVDTVYGSLFASNFYLATHQMAFDAIVSGTAVMKMGGSEDPSRRLTFEATPQYTVALEPGPAGEVWGVYRKLWTTSEMVRARWPETRWRPPPTEDPMRRFTVLDCVYYHPMSGVWYYDVVTEREEGLERIWEEDLLLSPWAVWRWSLRSGEVQGRSPVMDALPDVKTANEVIRILLEAASIRSAGVYLYKDGSILNPNTVTFQSGELIPVGDPQNDVRALELSGDVNLAQLVLTDQRESVHRTMLAKNMPPVEAGIRSATEIVERVRQMLDALGEPLLRVGEEVGRPVLRYAVYELSRRGHLRNVAPAIPTDVDGNPLPLTMNGSDLQLRFVSPLANAQRLTDAETIVQWLNMCLSTVGPAATQAGVRVEDVPEVLAEKMGAPDRLVRAEDERAEQMAQAQQAGGAGPPGGAQPPMGAMQ